MDDMVWVLYSYDAVSCVTSTVMSVHKSEAGALDALITIRAQNPEEAEDMFYVETEVLGD